MAFARELADRHHSLVLVARSIEPLRALPSQLRPSNRITVLLIAIDLFRPEAGQRLAAQLSCRVNRLAKALDL
jgi:short-subunit dehydrogenase